MWKGVLLKVIIFCSLRANSISIDDIQLSLSDVRNCGVLFIAIGHDSEIQNADTKWNLLRHRKIGYFHILP